jgi:hypothetical protein
MKSPFAHLPLEVYLLSNDLETMTKTTPQEEVLLQVLAQLLAPSTIDPTLVLSLSPIRRNNQVNLHDLEASIPRLIQANLLSIASPSRGALRLMNLSEPTFGVPTCLFKMGNGNAKDVRT